MTTLSLSNLLEGINRQMDAQEDLQTYLQQANALVRVSEISDFDQISNEMVHHYLSAVRDILEKANQLSELMTEGLDQLAKKLNGLPGMSRAAPT
jgi:uncharacterized phage infection (PIP) family protein YhgE